MKKIIFSRSSVYIDSIGDEEFVGVVDSSGNKGIVFFDVSTTSFKILSLADFGHSAREACPISWNLEFAEICGEAHLSDFLTQMNSRLAVEFFSFESFDKMMKWFIKKQKISKIH